MSGVIGGAQALLQNKLAREVSDILRHNHQLQLVVVHAVHTFDL